jgi:hypothetical protein
MLSITLMPKYTFSVVREAELGAKFHLYGKQY